ncbi:MAG TPA: nuclear transport factor 2 family protein [Gemmatimonadaceae bacterium]|nr:nuclear transport factor 2 family protein [Gemmatimonadaceae bacterium]
MRTTRIRVPLLLLVTLTSGATAATAATAARAQGAEAPARRAAGGGGRDSTAAQRALVRLEDSWAAALVRRDGATFRRLLAEGFVYTEDDRVMSRDELLREITAGSDTVTWAGNEGMRVHEFGATTAVVTGWLIVRGRGKDGAFDRRFRYTDSWVRRGGRWQIVAAQDYLVK